MGPSFQAGLFDMSDAEYFNISTENHGTELLEEDAPFDAAAKISTAASVFYVTTEEAAAMIGEMREEDDATMKDDENNDANEGGDAEFPVEDAKGLEDDDKTEDSI